MTINGAGRKETGLAKGDAAKIARIHRVSRQHVHFVALGVRVGRANLVETIERYRAKHAASRTQEPA